MALKDQPLEFNEGDVAGLADGKTMPCLDPQQPCPSSEFAVSEFVWWLVYCLEF